MAQRWWRALGIACALACGVLVAPWRTLPTDAFLALVCGREVAAHGIPRVDTLAATTAGHIWTDQQWLGQLVIYEVERLGGLRFAIVMQAFVIAATFAICATYALQRGASAASVMVCAIAGFGVGAASFTLRPQMFSLVGFAAILVLVRSRRVFWTIPILAVWANVHGAVALAAGVVGLRALFDFVAAARARKLAGAARAIALGVLAAVTPFCTPYARELPRYYREIGHLQDPVRELPIIEWGRVRWPDDWPFFAIFGAMLVLFVVVYWKKLSRPAPFETLVLAITGAAAWQASRHLQWFGVALAAYAPLAMEAVPPIRDGQILSRVATSLRVLGPVIALGLVVRLFVMKDDLLERDYPRGVLPVLASAAAELPASRIAVSDYFADWVLWYEPDLRGRVEIDVRFELLDDAQARAMGIFFFAKPGWDAIYPDARLVLVARKPHPTLDEKLGARAKVLWADEHGRLFAR